MRGREVLDAIDDRLPHGSRVLPYRGFELVHSRRDSLVERLRAQGAYEPAVVEAIVEELRLAPAQTLVDVGANIGLLSLAVLARDPQSHVFAFEPAPRQHARLAETIRRNRLETRLTLHRLAVSDRAGTTAFAVHRSRRSPGDGFLDTGRAGRARRIVVETVTLDGWWEAAGRPPVGVVKLDVEGSELLALRGAKRLLTELGPVVVLEAHPVNLRAYGWSVAEVRAELEGLSYAVEQLEETELIARPA